MYAHLCCIYYTVCLCCTYTCVLINVFVIVLPSCSLLCTVIKSIRITTSELVKQLCGN